MFWRRVGAAVLVVAALTAGNFIVKHIPDVDEQQRPFVRTATVGKTLDLRTFDASVVSVRGAAVISEDGQTHDTSGVWILVKIRLVAVHDATGVDYADLRDAKGRTYLASTRINQFLATGGYTLQPGVPVVGEVAFEVPVSVATHVSIRLADQTDTRLDAMADVPLPISADMVQQWKAEKTPVTLDEPAVAK